MILRKRPPLPESVGVRGYPHRVGHLTQLAAFSAYPLIVRE
jgi:hypothetical protein